MYVLFYWVQSFKGNRSRGTSNHTPESYPIQLSLFETYPAFNTYIYSNQQFRNQINCLFRFCCSCGISCLCGAITCISAASIAPLLLLLLSFCLFSFLPSAPPACSSPLLLLILLSSSLLLGLNSYRKNPTCGHFRPQHVLKVLACHEKWT